MPLRAPHLYESLRQFCLAAFAAERGAQVPFAFEEHATREGPSLYEYKPLIRGFVDEQAPTLRRLPDARNAIKDLKRTPAAAIFARAHKLGQTDEDALFRSILLPMLTWTAERCGGFDWIDEALDRWELSLFAEEPFRSSQVRDALGALLGGEGGAWAAAMRAAVLLGDKTKDRADLLAALREERLGRFARDAVRQALVEVLMHGSRTGLAETLDETLLGLRPRPASVLRVA